MATNIACRLFRIMCLHILASREQTRLRTIAAEADPHLTSILLLRSGQTLMTTTLTTTLTAPYAPSLALLCSPFSPPPLLLPGLRSRAFRCSEHFHVYIVIFALHCSSLLCRYLSSIGYCRMCFFLPPSLATDSLSSRCFGLRLCAQITFFCT